MDNNNLTMAQIVSRYNVRVNDAHAIGLTKHKPVNSKFKTIADGVRRLDALESAIRAREASERAVASEPVVDVAPETAPAIAEAAPQQETDMARKKKTKVRQRAPRQSSANGTTIGAKTEAYNQLVRESKREGICPSYARIHTSAFGSHEAADKQTARLKADIAALRRSAA